MKNTVLLILLLLAKLSFSQWTTFNTGVGKNISRIFSFSPSETYLLCQNKVLRSTDSLNGWKTVLSDTTLEFEYVYRYNSDSVLFNCIVKYSPTNYGAKIYRLYKNNTVKTIRNYTTSTVESNIIKFANDTFLNIFNNINGGYLGVVVTRYSFNPDLLPYPHTYAYIVYYINYAKLQDHQLLDDTIITLSNRIDYFSNESYPILSRNNIRLWNNDTVNQIEMKNLSPSRGFWAFTADNMILLGENYIARMPEFPILKNMNYYPDFSFKKILFTTKDTGYVIGRNTISNKGVMLRSTDGGKNWREQQLPDSPPINDIGLINSNTLIAVCDQGVILTTINGGGNNIGINSIKTENINFKLYPNPATNQLTIVNNYSLINSTYFIYSLQGQILQKGSISENKTTINISKLEPGCYFMNIDGVSQKFIKE